MTASRTRLLGLAAVAVGLAVVVALRTRARTGSSVPDAAPAGGIRSLEGQAPSFDASPAPPGGVVGTVSDAGGDGIVGAQVCALDGVLDDAVAPACAQTEAGGRYALRGGRPGTFCASAAGFVPACRRSSGGVVDLRLARGGALVRGVVRDLTGAPIEGALVRAEGDATALVFARSDAEGRFAIAVAAERIAITAEAPSYAPASADALAPEDAVELVLLTEAVLGGRVRKARTGEPLVDADVLVRAVDLGTTRRVRTATDGTFLVAGLAPDRYTIEASAPGWYGRSDGSVPLSLFQTSREIVVEVRPAARVEGRLVTPEGAGCAEGVVGLGPAGGAPTWQRATDATGRVALESVPPGRYVVAVRCAGFAAAPSYPEVVVGERPPTALTWVLAGATVALRGSVTDERGVPAGGIRIEARSTLAGSGGGVEAGARSDAQGRFELTDVRAGSYEIVPVSPAGEPLGAAVGRVVAPGAEAAPVALVARATGGVRGRVVGPDGAPGASRMILLAGEGAPSTVQATVGGVFAFEGLTPGRYRVGILTRSTPGGPPVEDAPLDATTRVDVEAAHTAEVVLRTSSAPGRITGRVVGPRGQAIQDAFVVATPDEPDGLSAPPPGGRPVLTGADGTFTLGGLAGGRHRVRAFQVAGDEGSLAAVRTGSTVTIRLVPRGSIAGRVTLGGRAIERFTLRVRGVEGAVWRDETFASPDGAFVLDGLPADLYELTADAAGGSTTRTVALGPAEARSGEQLALTPFGAVRGRVTDGAGAARAGIAILVMRARDGGLAAAGEPVASDADGGFAIEGLPAGPAVLQATDPTTQAAVDLEVSVRPGLATEVGPIVLEAAAGGDR